MAATAPVITAITFDQPSYATGQRIQVTVSYAPGSVGTVLTFTDTATDKASGLSGQLSATFTVFAPDATDHRPSDSGSHLWTLLSDNGTTAVITTTA